MAIGCAVIGGGLNCGASSLPEGRVLTWSELDGWEQHDCRPVYTLLHQFCTSPENPDDFLKPVCRALNERTENPDNQEARLFFENHFSAYEVKGKSERSGKGFLTGYYEPEFAGSLTRTDEFLYPLYAPPADYLTVPAGTDLPGIPQGRTAARFVTDGSGREHYQPLPPRGEIEKGALENLIRPIVYFKEPGHSFIIHVQGSARVRLPDHRIMRVAFAGRNGYPYSSIGRFLIEAGEIAKENMNLDNLLGWLRDNPGKAQDVMNHNESFIFFRIADELKDAEGPVGAAGIPLVPRISLAVDSTIWNYGLPVWLEGTLPDQNKKQQKLAGLHLALDTGAAITGAARADYYWGSGEKAGLCAGITSQNVRFVVLLPKTLFMENASATGQDAP